jgi:hypothetical protein
MEGILHDLCAHAALSAEQKLIQRQRGWDALPHHPGQALRPRPGRRRGSQKEEAILTVDLWPEPWTLDKTDPALRRREIFPMTEEGRTAVAQYLNDAYNAEPERWSAHPSILDCEPWTPPAPEPDAETQH